LLIIQNNYDENRKGKLRLNRVNVYFWCIFCSSFLKLLIHFEILRQNKIMLLIRIIPINNYEIFSVVELFPAECRSSTLLIEFLHCITQRSNQSGKSIQ